MGVNLGFRTGTSRRHQTKYSLPRPGGPRYIVVPRDHLVLVVEDLWHRQYTFLTRLGSKGTKIVSRADAAIEELQREGSYQWVFLDYDLGFGRTSEAVARHLLEIRFAGTAVIHSENDFGASLLSQILTSGEITFTRVPFSLLGILRANS